MTWQKSLKLSLAQYKPLRYHCGTRKSRRKTQTEMNTQLAGQGNYLSAPSRTRTDTVRILSPLPLPIGLWGLYRFEPMLETDHTIRRDGCNSFARYLAKVRFGLDTVTKA